MVVGKIKALKKSIKATVAEREIRESLKDLFIVFFIVQRARKARPTTYDVIMEIAT